MDDRQELRVLRNQQAIIKMLYQMAVDMKIGGEPLSDLICQQVDTRARVEVLERKVQRERISVRS